MSAVAFFLGYTLLLAGGACVLLLALIGVCKLINRASWAVLDCYGGIKTFNEFRAWHHAQQKGTQ